MGRIEKTWSREEEKHEEEKMVSKSLAIALTLSACALSRQAFGQASFYRGDCNMSLESDGTAVDIADAAALVSFLFGQSGGPPFETPPFQPSCMDACDANDDGVVDMSDPLFIINYVFRRGPFPPLPWGGLFKDENGLHLTLPGVDPTDDQLGCELAV
jgi:hypothetical protein